MVFMMVLSGALCFRWVFGQLMWGWSQKSEFQVDKKGPSPSWALTGSWEDGTNTALGALLAFFSLGKDWAGFSQSSDSKCVGWGMGLLTRQSRLAACHHWWGESRVPYRAPLLPPLAKNCHQHRLCTNSSMILSGGRSSTKACPSVTP